MSTLRKHPIKSSATFTEEELRKAFPNASAWFVKHAMGGQAATGAPAREDDAACVAAPTGIPAVASKPSKRRALVGGGEREKKGVGGFVMRFTFFARRPADADGYCVKQLIDGVVHAGILPRDDADVLRRVECETRSVSTWEDEGTIIEIYSVEDLP